jgi:hypothetical protein
VPIAVAYLVSVLLSLPLIVFSRTAGIGQVSWIHKPSPAEIVQSLLDSSGLIPLILGLILMSVEIYLGWKRRDVRVALLTSWLLVPGILAIALSYVSHPVYVIRYFIECIPPAALLMAHAISRIPSLNWRYTAFATVLLGSFTTIRHSYERPLMNWPAAMATVKSDSAEREALAFSPPGMLVAYRIAQEQAGSSSKTPIIYPNPNAPFWESKKMTQLAPAGYKTIWIFGQDRFMGDVGALIGGDYALASTTHDGPALVLQRFRSR